MVYKQFPRVYQSLIWFNIFLIPFAQVYTGYSIANNLPLMPCETSFLADCISTPASGNKTAPFELSRSGELKIHAIT